MMSIMRVLVEEGYDQAIYPDHIFETAPGTGGDMTQFAYAIGYSIMTYLNDVYSSEDLLTFSLNGYAATPENVAARNYPLGTQGYVVIRSDEPADSPARRLFNFFGSPLSDVILTRNGVTPLSDDGEQASQ